MTVKGLHPATSPGALQMTARELRPRTSPGVSQATAKELRPRTNPGANPISARPGHRETSLGVPEGTATARELHRKTSPGANPDSARQLRAATEAGAIERHFGDPRKEKSKSLPNRLAIFLIPDLLVEETGYGTCSKIKNHRSGIPGNGTQGFF